MLRERDAAKGQAVLVNAWKAEETNRRVRANHV